MWKGRGLLARRVMRIWGNPVKPLAGTAVVRGSPPSWQLLVDNSKSPLVLHGRLQSQQRQK